VKKFAKKWEKFSNFLKPQNKQKKPWWVGVCLETGVDLVDKIANEQVHRMFLRGILGVNKTTSTFVLLGEFGRYPLEYFWWQQTLKYYDRLRKSTADRLLYCADQTQIQMLNMLNDKKQCWLRNVRLWLKHQGVEVLYANIKCAITSAQASYLESTYGEQARTKSNRLRTYQLMNTSCTTESGYSYAHQRYLQVITNVQLRQSLLRFRCSNHRF
jgi:hypothetical protein